MTTTEAIGGRRDIGNFAGTETPSAEVVLIPDFGEVEIIPASDTSGCVDPRKPKNIFQASRQFLRHIFDHSYVSHAIHTEGAERSPGGSLGKVMSLMGAVPDLSPERAVDIVQAWEEHEKRKFFFHGDDHDHHDGLGCGHVDKARDPKNSALYGISSDRMEVMMDYIWKKIDNGNMRVKLSVYTDEHNEDAVLIVKSMDTTVAATTTDDMHKFFRFDETRHDARLDCLAEFAQTEGVNVTAEDLINAAQQQRIATLMLLAAGKPIFEVDLRDKTNPTVIFKGNVPDLQ